MAFKIEGKEMYPIFVYAKCCWSIHSKLVRLGKHAHSRQEREKSHSYTNSAVSRHVQIHALLVQHLYSVFFQNTVWDGPTSAETA